MSSRSAIISRRFSLNAAKLAAAGVVAVAVMLVVSPSRAQIGDKKTFVFGVDRVMGFVWSKVKVDLEGPPDEVTTTRQNLALFSQQDAMGPFSNPRFAFDYFVTNGLSLGGTIGYWSQNGEISGYGAEADLPDQHLFTVAPRVGYGAMFGRVVGIWPRAGLTYFTGEVNVDLPINRSVDVSGLGLNLDVPFVFVPVNHFAILAGPGLDFTVTGGGEFGNVDYDLSIFHVGLHVGFVGYL